MSLPSNAQRAIDNGYEFRFGDYVGKGFELVQKNAGLFIGFTLVFFIILGMVGVFSAAIDAFLPMATGLLSAIIIGQILKQLISNAVSIPLYTGYAIASQKTETGQILEFGDFFSGFSKWSKLFLTSIMSAFITLLACLPGLYFILQGGIDFTDQQWFMHTEDIDINSILIGSAIILIPALYFITSYLYAPLFVWFYDMSGWDALEASRKLVSHNFFSVLGFFIIMSIIAGLGVILLCVGALFTVPACYAGIYASFADAVKLNSGDADEDVINHFSPENQF